MAPFGACAGPGPPCGACAEPSPVHSDSPSHGVSAFPTPRKSWISALQVLPPWSCFIHGPADWKIQEPFGHLVLVLAPCRLGCGTGSWEKLLGAEFFPAKCQGAASLIFSCSEFIILMEKKCLKPSVVAQCSLWHRTQQWWKKSKQKCEEPDKTHGKYLVLYKWAQCLCLKCCLSFE